MALVSPSKGTLEELIDDLNSDNEDNTSLPHSSQPYASIARVGVPEEWTSGRIDLRSLQQQSMIIKYLPIEILIDLSIKYLNIHDIRSIMNVCKYWHVIYQGDHVWKGFYYNYLEKIQIKNQNQILTSVSINSSPSSGSNNPIDDNQHTPPHSGFVIVSSPQQLAQLLSNDRQRIELMELNRLEDNNSTVHEGDRSLIRTSSKQTPDKQSTSSSTSKDKMTWNHYLAIPSSFLQPSVVQSYQSDLEKDYSNLPPGKWYFRYKQVHSEIFCSNCWKSLAESWKWLRSALRDRLYLNWKTSFYTLSTDISVSSSTITRAAGKMTSINWIRFYETLKEEMTLQADALALDMIDAYSSQNDHFALLQYTNKICQIYIDWCNELEGLLIPLNSKIADDQEDDVCRPCKRMKEDPDECYTKPERTPHIENLCSIILRSRCLLNWRICNSLKKSIQVLCDNLEAQSFGTSPTNPNPIDPIVHAILKFYDLIQSLDVPDDTFCSHFRYDSDMNQHLSILSATQQIFRSTYYDFLLSQHVLLPYIRAHDRKKQDEMTYLLDNIVPNY